MRAYGRFGHSPGGQIVPFPRESESMMANETVVYEVGSAVGWFDTVVKHRDILRVSGVAVALPCLAALIPSDVGPLDEVIHQVATVWFEERRGSAAVYRDGATVMITGELATWGRILSCMASFDTWLATNDHLVRATVWNWAGTVFSARGNDAGVVEMSAVGPVSRLSLPPVGFVPQGELHCVTDRVQVYEKDGVWFKGYDVDHGCHGMSGVVSRADIEWLVRRAWWREWLSVRAISANDVALMRKCVEFCPRIMGDQW